MRNAFLFRRLFNLLFALTLFNGNVLAVQLVPGGVDVPKNAPELSGRVDLRQKMNTLEQWRQTQYEALRASGKATAADYRAVDEQMLKIARKAEGQRQAALDVLNQHSGVTVKQGSGGTQPMEGRGLAGDIDTASMTPRDYDRVRKTAERMGYTVTQKGDSFTIEELNVTAHRQSAVEAKMGSRAGSSAYTAETGRGFNEETALGFKQNNPSASVSDNLKKAAHTLDTPAGDLSMADVQKMGKMAGRNLEELSKLDPQAAARYDTLQQQAKMLKEGYSPEAAGIVRDNATAAERAQDLASFQKEVREMSVSSIKATDAWAEGRAAELGKNVTRAQEMLERAKLGGDAEHVQEVKNLVDQSREELARFRELQAASKEAAVVSDINGKSAANILSEAKGIPTEGEPPSAVREKLLGSDRSGLAKTANEPPVGAAEGEGAELAAKGGMGSKMVKGAMGILTIYQIYTGVTEGASQAGEEAGKGNDSFTASILKTAGYSLWHGLGFDSAMKTGTQAGEDSAKQWAADVKAGTVDPSSKLSQAWAQLRGVGWGLSQFTGLSSIKDAILEGGGALKDRYDQYQKEREAQRSSESTRQRREAKAEKERQEREKAEKDRLAAENAARKEAGQDKEKDKDAARREAAEQAARDKLAGTGIHEEVSGWEHFKDGSSMKLVYIRDAAGNTLKTIKIFYDKNGKEIRREVTVNKPDKMDGAYAGKFSGMAGGSLQLTIKGSSVTGRSSGTSDEGDAVNATITGTVDASGNIRAQISGVSRGTFGSSSKVETWQFSGAFTGKISGNSASGSWTATGWKKRGSWSASKK